MLSVGQNTETRAVRLPTDWATNYWDWLSRSALPLWARAGVDPKGGFQELLALDGHPVAAPRRSRVQARQSFVFAYAGRLGWEGPWGDIAVTGLNWLDSHCRRHDGLYSTLSAADGAIIDHTAFIYDQTFVLLAAAELHRHNVRTGWDKKAQELMGCIQILRRHSEGGFQESGGLFLSNPHMHLLEACLSWIEADGSSLWWDVSRETVALALNRLIDPSRKVLREEFDGNWWPAPGRSGNSVEPGHQFEWAWLLERWSRLSGDIRAHDAALTLFAAGLRGVDTGRGVAIDETDINFIPRRSTARLWPQAEWLKAACILGDTIQKDAAAATLWRYLETPTEGLWRDKMREDGSFVDEPSPASSLYHLICATASLNIL